MTSPSRQRLSAGESLDGDRLTDLLMRLLLDPDLRSRLADEGAEAVAADAGELECLATIDLTELETAARRLRSGSGIGLATTFPRSLRLLRADGTTESDLLTGFLASAHFGRFRLVPYTGPGLSAQEAYASYLLDLAEAPLLRDTVTHELMIALFTALTCEQPLSFVIAAEGIVRTDRGHAAVRSYAAASVATWTARGGAQETALATGSDTVPYAYFATSAGVARGVVSRRTAAFDPTETAARQSARRALARRGLW